MIRLLIVDDQSLIREGIASLLGLQEDLEVIALAQNGLEAVQAAQTHEPDVILMDIRMPELDGISATTQIKSFLPNCQILMLTTFDDEDLIVKALQAGASGYLLKDLPTQDLAKAIRLLDAGIYQLDPQVAGLLIKSLQQNSTKEDFSKIAEKTGLTEREQDVLKLIGQGCTNKEIAKHLDIGLGTVKTHVSNVLMRLELRDRTAAAIFAHEHVLV